MPWSNQSGGPWRNPPGPWGNGPQNGPGNQPPDLEELLRRGQDRLKTVLPGGGFGGRGILVLIALAIIAWLLSGLYRVQPDEEGVVLRFGKFVQTTQPGLNYHLPYPIERVETPKVTRVNRLDVGMRVVESRVGGLRDVPEESLMLTGDENIVDVDFSVFWVISNAGKYLFNIQNQEQTIKAVAESAMREVIGRSNIQPILTGARQGTEIAVQELMQKTLDEYNAGVTITQVQLQKVDPPNQVIDAFRDVQAARADQERMQNEAQTYANSVVPQSRGQAAQIQQVAESYKQRTVAEAQGAASRFDQILLEYQKAPDVTRKRLYLETMERVLGGSDKIILDDKAGQGVVPYLPLNELSQNGQSATRRPATPGAAAASALQSRGDAQQ
jgi:modulator of FtsH protease HflK